MFIIFDPGFHDIYKKNSFPKKRNISTVIWLKTNFQNFQLEISIEQTLFWLPVLHEDISYDISVKDLILGHIITNIKENML